MASGKASKKARKARVAVPTPRPQARARGGLDRRLVLGGGLLAALLVAVVLGIVLTRDSGTTADPGELTTLPGAEDAAAIFRGIPQDGLALGRADAPVTVVEWIDLQCPFCRDFEVETLPQLVEKHVRPGKVRLELRGLAFIGPDSERGLRAVLAAALQDGAYGVMENLYFNQGAENSGWLDEDMVAAAANSTPGIDVARLLDDMDSDDVSSLISAHAQEAEERDISSTPTILVGPTGGTLKAVELDPTDFAGLERAIAAVPD